MELTIGTFNLNNLFSRYNFKAEIGSLNEGEAALNGETLYTFSQGSFHRTRTYLGRLVKGKDSAMTDKIAERILRMDLDVLCVQEVEDIDTLKAFNQGNLGGRYAFVGLIEGNDDRLIDVGILSKYPIDYMRSWRHTVHPDVPERPVFSRDLLEVRILDAARSKPLLTVFNTHLKSNFVEFSEEDPQGAEAENLEKRKRQSEAIAAIMKRVAASGEVYVLLGDMNDTQDSPALAPFRDDPALGLVDGLKNPKETRPPKKDDPPPASAAWTHRFKEGGKPAEYLLYDQIWLSPALAARQIEAWIDRRTLHKGDGSDHDPAWIKVEVD